MKISTHDVRSIAVEGSPRVIVAFSRPHIVLAFFILLSVAYGTKLLGVSFTVGVFMVFLLFDCTIGLHLHSVDAVERPL